MNTETNMNDQIIVSDHNMLSDALRTSSSGSLSSLSIVSNDFLDDLSMSSEGGEKKRNILNGSFNIKPFQKKQNESNTTNSKKRPRKKKKTRSPVSVASFNEGSSALFIKKTSAEREEDEMEDTNNGFYHNETHDGFIPSFNISEDAWTIQGNKTSKTDGTFYTGCTDGTGVTKVHKNGVSAMIYRKLKRQNSKRRKEEKTLEQNQVPSSINTNGKILRKSDCNYHTSVALSTENERNKSPASTRVRILRELDSAGNGNTHAKLAARKLRLGWAPDRLALDIDNETSSHESGKASVPENGDYHAGSQALACYVQEKIRNMFECCSPDQL